MTQDAQHKKPKFQDPRKFFIIYKEDSGKDFAEHVHTGLHEGGVDTFFDKEDLREDLSAPEWRAQIDRAIESADVFIFIVTTGASTSKDVKHELKEARKGKGKIIKAFVHDHIWDVEPELTIDMDGERINIKDFQVRKFETKQELLRDVVKSASIVRALKF